MTDSLGEPPVFAICWFGPLTGRQNLVRINGHRREIRVRKRHPASD